MKPLVSSVATILPVVCDNDKCSKQRSIINEVIIPLEDEKGFVEYFGRGNEDPAHDVCKHCGVLGSLSDHYAHVVQEIDVKKGLYFGVAFDAALVDLLFNLLKQYREDRSKHAPAYVYVSPNPIDLSTKVCTLVCKGCVIKTEDFDSYKMIVKVEGVVFRVAKGDVMLNSSLFRDADLRVIERWLKTADL